MNKLLSVLAVAAILGVSFYAGQKSFGSSLEYEHADVLDISSKCADGAEFIGKCTNCKSCALTEYEAGGCSYFKDTFCTLCTSIRNCKQINTQCTTKNNQHCIKCDDGYFVDPASPGKCTQCTTCSSTKYVRNQCRSGSAGINRFNREEVKDRNTVCKPCTQCTDAAQGGTRSFLTSVCSVGGNGITEKSSAGIIHAGKALNSECLACRVCLDGFEYTADTCQSPKKLGLEAGQKPWTPVEQVQAIDGKTMPTDTVCARCTGCMSKEHPGGDSAKSFATAVCKDSKDKDTGLFKVGDAGGHSRCESCEQCKEGSFISSSCETGHPHKEWMCRKLADPKGTPTKCDTGYDSETRQPQIKDKDEYVTTTVPAGLGKDSVCQDCTPRKGGEWTVFPCNPKHTSDAVHQKCSKCVEGEYQFQECQDNSDTICPSCPNAREKLFKNMKGFKSGLQYCDTDPATGLPKTQCVASQDKDGASVPKSTKCGYWEGIKDTANFKYDGARHMLPQDQDRCLPYTRGGQHPSWSRCGQWKSGCKEGFFGQSCCFHKHAYSCGVDTTRERSGKRLKYPKAGTESERQDGKNTRADFAEFCMSLCSEFPDCLAVEVQDDGSFANPEGNLDESSDSKSCFFKSAFTQDQRFRWAGAYTDSDGVKREGDPKFDCYSNTCRQNIYTMNGAKPLKITNYKVPAKKQSNEELNAAAVALACKPKCDLKTACMDEKKDPKQCVTQDTECKTCTTTQLHKLATKKQIAA